MYEKKYYININGEDIEVSEEIYKEYMRHKWREEKQYKTRLHREAQLDDNLVSKDELIEDIVADKILLEELYKTIESLNHNERLLIKELFINNISERELARKMNMPRKTLSYRKNKILDKIRKFTKL